MLHACLAWSHDPVSAPNKPACTQQNAALHKGDGAEEIRTPGPHVANVMLYQLSYRPRFARAKACAQALILA